MPLYTNQFKQGNAVGTLDLNVNPNPFSMVVQYQSGGTGNLVPGEGVILDDLGASDYNSLPQVDKRALTADAIEGVVIFDPKRASATPGTRITIAKKHAVVFMNSGAALLRGAKVELVLATAGNVITQSAGALFGKALDKATAADELIRVEILTDGVV